MVELVRFKREHLFEINLMDRDKKVAKLLAEKHLDRMEKLGLDKLATIMSDEGSVGIVGFNEMWPTRAEVWAIMSKGKRHKFLAAHKILKRRIEQAPYSRLEYVAENSFPEAHRWAAALGFQIECGNLRCFSLNGEDCSMYSIIKEK